MRRALSWLLTAFLAFTGAFAVPARRTDPVPVTAAAGGLRGERCPVRVTLPTPKRLRSERSDLTLAVDPDGRSLLLAHPLFQRPPPPAVAS